MSVEKIKGIETEWSISVKNKDGFRPAEISHFETMIGLIREYLGMFADSRERFIGEIENMDRIRGFESNSSRHSHHNLLPNGGRLYIDGEHLEYSTPECLSSKTLVAADMAGEAIIGLAKNVINEELVKKGEELLIFKDNTDRMGNSYGCHENYLISRRAFNSITNPVFSLDLGYLASFFICRLMFTGSGKMGIEEEWKRLNGSVYQISQRADFIKQLLAIHTTSDRPLVNTRDEPLADEKKFGRLHVICGDANLAETANYMKVGITSIILKMIEDGFLRGDIIVADPVKGIKLSSFDLTCKEPVLETREGRKLSGLDLNEEFFQQAQNYFSDICQPSLEEIDLLRLWEETIEDFRSGAKLRPRRRFDWQIKLGLFEDFLEELGFSWGDLARAEFLNNGRRYKVADHFYEKDLLYHNIDKEKGLYWACKEDGDVEKLVSKEDVINLIKNPPPECRSYFRGRCISEFFDKITMVDWHEIIFRDKGSGLVVNLDNPAWGGRGDTEEIFDKVKDIDDFIAELKKREV